MLTEVLKSRRFRIAAGVSASVLLVGWLFAYEPVTRNLVARDQLCTYCHIEQEYIPTMLTSVEKPHPRTPSGADRARCVDCHLPEGFWRTTYAYTHFASITDLFGQFRDRRRERAGDWIPPRAATAHRVRVRLHENDSVTCRTCHDVAVIEPRSVRGQMAHREARMGKQTCIECHFNMAHRQVELRVGTFDGAKPNAPAERQGEPAPGIDIVPVAAGPLDK